MREVQLLLTYWFSEDVKNRISDDLSINGNDVSTFRQSPDTVQSQSN